MSKILGIGLIASCGLVVLAGAGCNSSSTLDQQAMCSNKAEQINSDDNAMLAKLDNKPTETVQSHYNQNLDKCFVLKERDFQNDTAPGNLNGGSEIYQELSDAFGGTIYATADWLAPANGSVDLSNMPNNCNLNGKSCTTAKDFTTFVDSYMNN